MTTADSPPGAEIGAHAQPMPELVPELPTWVPVAYGVVTALLGVAILAWPKATVVVIVLLLVIQLIIGAVYQFVYALSSGTPGAVRALLAVGGTLSLLLALLLLRKPLQTVAVVTMLVGLWWIIRGVIDVFEGLAGHTVQRGWSVVLGVISLVAGVYVVLNPGISLAIFIWVTGFWLVLTGIVIAAAPLLFRRRHA